MPTCPSGHESTASDYCDTCGLAMEAKPAPAPEEAAAAESEAESGPAGTPCPQCGEPVVGRYCESCGYDIEEDVPAQIAPALTLHLGADRGRWEKMVGSGEPAYPSEPATLSLEVPADKATLGRVASGTAADVDLALSGPVGDPAISHRQCEFELVGTDWLVRDLGSANGTWINDSEEPLANGETHTLADGDRIFMGAWTCLSVRLNLPTT